MIYFDVHNTKQSLIGRVRRLIDCHNHAKVYTYEYLASESLKKYGFVHKQVCRSQKEYTRVDVHVNNCECRSNLYQLWMEFQGNQQTQSPGLYKDIRVYSQHQKKG
jgi:hypothetical protein